MSLWKPFIGYGFLMFCIGSIIFITFWSFLIPDTVYIGLQNIQTIIGMITIMVSAIALYLGTMKPHKLRYIMGQIGWGRNPKEKAYKILQLKEPENTVGLLTPLSSAPKAGKNIPNQALFLINHGLKPKKVALLFSKESADGPENVFDMANKIYDDAEHEPNHRFLVEREDISFTACGLFGFRNRL